MRGRRRSDEDEKKYTKREGNNPRGVGRLNLSSFAGPDCEEDYARKKKNTLSKTRETLLRIVFVTHPFSNRASIEQYLCHFVWRKAQLFLEENPACHRLKIHIDESRVRRYVAGLGWSEPNIREEIHLHTRVWSTQVESVVHWCDLTHRHADRYTIVCQEGKTTCITAFRLSDINEPMQAYKRSKGEQRLNWAVGGHAGALQHKLHPRDGVLLTAVLQLGGAFGADGIVHVCTYTESHKETKVQQYTFSRRTSSSPALEPLIRSSTFFRAMSGRIDGPNRLGQVALGLRYEVNGGATSVGVSRGGGEGNT